MSVWKKAAKAHQKTHKERHQPEHREHLGILEKKKDYRRRAADANEKKETLKLLNKRALNKNPDEFYHHMINSKVEKGEHFEKETESDDTPEQIKLMQTQDYKYIVTKRTQEKKKIEKLQAQLHLSSINHNVKNHHIIFDDDKHKKRSSVPEEVEGVSLQLKKALPDVNIDVLIAATDEKKALYKELVKRIEREKELAVIQEKLEINRHLKNKTSVLKPKRIKMGTKNHAAVYLWKYERKK